MLLKENYLNYKIGLNKEPNDNQEYPTIKAFNNNHNKTFFINELTPTNFKGAINKLSVSGKDIVFENKTPEGNEFNTEKALYSAVVLKDLISEFIWFLIGGTLAFSTAHVYSKLDQSLR